MRDENLADTAEGRWSESLSDHQQLVASFWRSEREGRGGGRKDLA